MRNPGRNARTRHLATKDAELMAEYRDLDVLLVRGRSESNQIEQLTNEQEGDRTTHSDDRGRCTPALLSGRIARLHPSPIAASISRSPFPIPRRRASMTRDTSRESIDSAASFTSTAPQPDRSRSNGPTGIATILIAEFALLSDAVHRVPHAHRKSARPTRLKLLAPRHPTFGALPTESCACTFQGCD